MAWLDGCWVMDGWGSSGLFVLFYGTGRTDRQTDSGFEGNTKEKFLRRGKCWLASMGGLPPHVEHRNLSAGMRLAGGTASAPGLVHREMARRRCKHMSMRCSTG